MLSRARNETIFTPTSHILDVLMTSIVFTEMPGKAIVFKAHHVYRLIVGKCARVQ